MRVIYTQTRTWYMLNDTVILVFVTTHNTNINSVRVIETLCRCAVCVHVMLLGTQYAFTRKAIMNFIIFLKPHSSRTLLDGKQKYFKCGWSRGWIDDNQTPARLLYGTYIGGKKIKISTPRTSVHGDMSVLWPTEFNRHSNVKIATVSFITFGRIFEMTPNHIRVKNDFDETNTI